MSLKIVSHGLSSGLRLGRLVQFSRSRRISDCVTCSFDRVRRVAVQGDPYRLPGIPPAYPPQEPADVHGPLAGEEGASGPSPGSPRRAGTGRTSSGSSDSAPAPQPLPGPSCSGGRRTP